MAADGTGLCWPWPECLTGLTWVHLGLVACIPGTETDIATGLPQWAGGWWGALNTITTIAIAFMMSTGPPAQRSLPLRAVDHAM